MIFISVSFPFESIALIIESPVSLPITSSFIFNLVLASNSPLNSSLNLIFL
jgi:hypothetical protein